MEYAYKGVATSQVKHTAALAAVSYSELFHKQTMSHLNKFAIVGYGFLGAKILTELAQKKATGIIESLLVVSRSVSLQVTIFMLAPSLLARF